MANVNLERFEALLSFIHSHINGKYTLYDNEGKSVEAVYDTDYESDNGLDEDEEGYEEYQCIAFKRISDGDLFEVNYHQIPVKAVCDGEVIY
ncbi:MAG: hypothetical protein K6E33_03225 [Lachnospiraceae bacterium]|nr:hypothetical protein [Lachnospiraceae bacterium]